MTRSSPTPGKEVSLVSRWGWPSWCSPWCCPSSRPAAATASAAQYSHSVALCKCSLPCCSPWASSRTPQGGGPGGWWTSATPPSPSTSGSARSEGHTGWLLPAPCAPPWPAASRCSPTSPPRATRPSTGGRMGTSSSVCLKNRKIERNYF